MGARKVPGAAPPALGLCPASSGDPGAGYVGGEAGKPARSCPSPGAAMGRRGREGRGLRVGSRACGGGTSSRGSPPRRSQPGEQRVWEARSGSESGGRGTREGRRWGQGGRPPALPLRAASPRGGCPSVRLGSASLPKGGPRAPPPRAAPPPPGTAAGEPRCGGTAGQQRPLQVPGATAAGRVLRWNLAVLHPAGPRSTLLPKGPSSEPGLAV